MTRLTVLILTLILGTQHSITEGASSETNGKVACEWTAVKRSVMIDFNMDNQLDIRTTSSIGSRDYVRTWFFDRDSNSVGGVSIYLYSVPKYYITWCGVGSTVFPVEPPSTKDKIWNITVTKDSGYRILIHCNGVKVLDVLLSSTTCPHRNYSTGKWSRNITKLKFLYDDTASVDYRFFKDADSCYWRAVKRRVQIDFDMDNPLEIRTDSITWSQESVAIKFYDRENRYVGAIKIRFQMDPLYYIEWCTVGYNNFPVKLPSTMDKIWRLTFTKNSGNRHSTSRYRILILYCNGVKVLSYVLRSERWRKDITQLEFMYDDTASDYYRFFRAIEPETTESEEKIDVIPEDNNPCPDNAYHCASGECWVKEEVENGVYAGSGSEGHSITKCLCIIKGEGIEAGHLRKNSYRTKDDMRYPMVQFIQCKEKDSNDMTKHEETKVKCGWFFEDQKDWNNGTGENYWNYGWTVGLQTVGTPHDCQASAKELWDKIVIVLSVIGFVLIFTLIIWKIRKKGNTNSRTHRAIPAQHEPEASEIETPPQRPSDPTILRTASIPTYRECLDGSDRIVAENNYVTLPTDEPSAPPYNDGTLEGLPPAYEDVQAHQDLYTVADVEQQNSAIYI